MATRWIKVRLNNAKSDKTYYVKITPGNGGGNVTGSSGEVSFDDSHGDNYWAHANGRGDEFTKTASETVIDVQDSH